MILFPLLFAWAVLAHPMACDRVGPLPDRACTPGVVLTVSLDTICRAPASARRHVSGATRVAAWTRYGVPKDERGRWTLDHLVSLELGGASDDPANLWPEDKAGAVRKDRIENALHRLVCAGRMTPAEAQRRIASDWTTALEGTR